MNLRVATYNIRHGLGNDPGDPSLFGEYDLERVAEVIRRTDPDVVGLQEIDRLLERSRFQDQPALLGGMLGMESCFGGNVLFDPGEYGVAILSRFPISSFTNNALPTMEGWETRGFLEAAIDVHGYGRILVLNTHLQVSGRGAESEATLQRGAQAQTIAGRVRLASGPVLLMGDFNAEAGDPELEPLAFLSDAWEEAGDGGPGYTIPAHPAAQPSRRIDMIYVNDGFGLNSASVVREQPARLASDHLPVVADLTICRRIVRP